MRPDEDGGERSGRSPDKALWQRSRALDMPADEAERFLDLAGFAEGRLDADECERVAALIAADPEAASDVEVARSLAGLSAVAPAAVVARASAIIGDGVAAEGRVIRLPLRRWQRPTWRTAAQWSSLAAAIAMASWLGFAMGSDASFAFAPVSQTSDEGPLGDMLDPATGFLGGFGEGRHT